MGPTRLAGLGCGSAAYTASRMPPPPSWQDPQVLARWAGLPLPVLLGYLVDQGLPMQAGLTAEPNSARSAPAVASVLCAAFEVQEQSLLWCVLRYARLVRGAQLERDLSSLVGADHRGQLAQLPVFMMGLGQQLKPVEQRTRLIWAYASFSSTMVCNSKVRRYIQHNALDQASLQRYLAKLTVSELQALKAESLPWWRWDMGQKAHQAAELAEYLWWLRSTWTVMRAAAGMHPMPH
ncbi:hypothetical protein COO60DRAFT_580164 [Scenedesmus sp. NREL 46B-D3]|nr:hypothetical protein COO60DRAFT_580164 [Scenedesmus sp. NREL 46B-D3]